MRMTEKLRAAVIGLGSMGANHARVLADLGGVELVAVADADEGRLARIAQSGVTTYTAYDQLLAEARPDMVCVVVPTTLHRKVALDCFAAGAHVLVEKPIAASLPEARELADAAARAGRVLAVGHIERFNPAIQELKRRLDDGQGGRILQVRARRVGPFPHRIRDVGVIHDLAPHDIDVLRFLLGDEVERVYAHATSHIATDHEDLFAGMLHFRSGVLGILEINWLTPTKERSVSVLCERGLFVANYATQTLEFYENFAATAREGSPASVTEGPMTRYAVVNREPLRVELEAFRDAILAGGPAAVGAIDGIAALAVAEALVESARRQEPVALDAVPAAAP